MDRVQRCSQSHFIVAVTSEIQLLFIYMHREAKLNYLMVVKMPRYKIL